MSDSNSIQREEHADRGIPVMVRLEAAELETVDRLITTCVAPARAEALRWALGRLREAGRAGSM